MPRFAEAIKERRYRETTNIDIGSVPAAIVPYINHQEQLLEIHKTVFPLNDLPITIADATVGAGTKIFTFPQGRILILGAHAKDIQLTTTSVIASTLNSGVNVGVGVGSTTQANGTLATTEQNVVNVFTAVSSATINVAGAAAQGNGPSAPFSLDGTTTAVDLYFNLGIPTATDIDADATVTVDGLIEVVWALIGDH